MPAESFPTPAEHHEHTPQPIAELGGHAVDAELAAGRAEQVYGAIGKVAEHFPELGNANEAFALRLGNEVTVPVLNYGEQPMTEATSATIAAAVERVAWTVGLNNLEKMDATIAITPGDAAISGTNIKANADRKSHVVRVASAVFESEQLTEKSREDYDQMVGADVSSAEITIVHELGHVGEFTATKDRTDENDPRVVDDYFAGTAAGKDPFSSPIRSRTPVNVEDAKVRVYQDGAYVVTTGEEAYGPGVAVQSPTTYGRKTPGEYYAESYTGYAYDGNVDQPLKDLVRATIDTQMPGGMAEAGPIPQAQYERIV